MSIDDPLTELLDLIRGGNKSHGFGPGITTWPAGDDNNKKLHAGCVQLESRGLIYRQQWTETSVLWMPCTEGEGL